MPAFVNLDISPCCATGQVTEDEVRSLVKEIDTKGDGRITLNQFASFVNLDDHDPLFQSLFDGRRRNVNLLKVREWGGDIPGKLPPSMFCHSC